MFYCNDCAKRNEWPETFFKSYGECEVCEEIAECNERKSSLLPMPKTTEEEISLEHLSAYLPYGVNMFAHLVITKFGQDNSISREFVLSELIGLTHRVKGHNPPEYLNKYKVQLRGNDQTHWHGEYLEDYKLVLRPLSCLSDTFTYNGDEVAYIDLLDDSDRQILELDDPFEYNDIESISSRCRKFLLQHHFDIFNLIEKGQAISIIKLEKLKNEQANSHSTGDN